jgi:predicted aspartyl protease
MEGHLDATNVAWLPVELPNGRIDFMIDTGFRGTLIVGEELFDPSQADWAGELQADLAAGQSWMYLTYLVEVLWHSELTRIEVLIGPGTECLIGTDLLHPHRLEIDYHHRSVQLLMNEDWHAQ